MLSEHVLVKLLNLEFLLCSGSVPGIFRERHPRNHSFQFLSGSRTSDLEML